MTRNDRRILALTLESLEVARQLLAYLKEHRADIWFADAHITEIETTIASDERVVRKLASEPLD